MSSPHCFIWQFSVARLKIRKCHFSVSLSCYMAELSSMGSCSPIWQPEYWRVERSGCMESLSANWADLLPLNVLRGWLVARRIDTQATWGASLPVGKSAAFPVWSVRIYIWQMDSPLLLGITVVSPAVANVAILFSHTILFQVGIPTQEITNN